MASLHYGQYEIDYSLDGTIRRFLKHGEPLTDEQEKSEIIAEIKEVQMSRPPYMVSAFIKD